MANHFEIIYYILLTFTLQISIWRCECYDSGPIPNSPEAPFYLGTVNGKAYYGNNTIRMNWTEASDYCNEFDLELASIKTREEVDMLRGTLPSLLTGQQSPVRKRIFQKEYNRDRNRFWTSGIESKFPLTFAWGKSGDRPEINLFDSPDDSDMNPDSNRYCIFAWNYEDEKVALRTERCQSKLGVLCQLQSELSRYWPDEIQEKTAAGSMKVRVHRYYGRRK